MKILNIGNVTFPCSAYTNYPFTILGDKAFEKAPMREVTVIGYDNDKYCEIVVNGINQSIKAGYLYGSPDEVKAENKNLFHRHNDDKDKPKGIKERNKKG